MILARIATACARRRWAIMALALVLAAGSVWAIRTHLSVTTDTALLFSARLPWKQRAAELQNAFPQNEDLLVAVVDAGIPEEAEATAHDLAAALASDHLHFARVVQPDASPYLARNAFLFLDPPMLRNVLDHTIDAQPFLSRLVADPSLRGLAGAFSLIAQGVARGQANLAPFLPALRGFAASLHAAAEGHPAPLSWENLLAGPVAQLAGRYRFVLAKPRLDYGAVEPGEDASQAIRRAARRLEFVQDGRARVRLTGSVALDDEEFSTVAQGAVWGLLGSAVLVALWLFLAVGSWRMVVPILLTLLLGLLLTGGFAALAVGTLNVVSVAFAILFIGIAVDFAIQFSVQLRATRMGSPGLAAAIGVTAGRTGLQILVASLATAAGFLAFTPTAFIGVAQLGLIAGAGMLIAFACTMTLLPAFLAVFSPRAVPVHDNAAGFGARFGARVEAHRRSVVAVFGGLALLGLALTPYLGFDSDPLHTKNVHTEAMRTLTDLINDPVTNPYTMEMLAAPQDVTALAARLQKLPLVDSVIWLRSFVPDRQTEKLAMIQDASELLAVTLAEPVTAPPVAAPPVNAAALRQAVSAAARDLAPALPKLPHSHPLAAIHADLVRLGAAPDSVLLGASEALTRFLPLQMARLRDALGATPVAEADVPELIRSDWVAADGRDRLQVTPKPSVRGSAALRAFMEQVQGVAPGSAGSAVTIVQSAATVVGAFRVAAVSALAAITLLLAGILRRALDVALVLAPLLLSSLLTVLVSVLLHLSLNFANIIALPLLLGVGVSFNVYLVMGWRAGQVHPLDSAMARAVAFSALTTGTAFGSLALSHHPGTASMGALLLVSLACMVASTLLFLPALLASVPARPRIR